MKNIITVLFFVSLAFLCFLIPKQVVADYQFKRDIQAHWNLADKSSSINEKARHMDNYVLALEGIHAEGEYNALWFKTQDNLFDTNMDALKSLQTRLHEISTMDVASFEYQTAIQQITQQEQGEAGEMLSVFRGIWYRHNHPMLWKIYGTMSWLFAFFWAGIIIGHIPFD